MSSAQQDYVNSPVVTLHGTPYVGSGENPKVRRRLAHGGGNGGGGVETMVPIKDYIDARDDSVESRLGAKLDKAIAAIDAVAATVPTKEEAAATQRSLSRTIWSGAATVLGIGLAFLAFGGDRFDAGMSAAPMIAQVQSKQEITDKNQDAKLALMDDKLDLLLKQTAAK
jgi:hypothetical protein